VSVLNVTPTVPSSLSQNAVRGQETAAGTRDGWRDGSVRCVDGDEDVCWTDRYLYFIFEIYVYEQTNERDAHQGCGAIDFKIIFYFIFSTSRTAILKTVYHCSFKTFQSQ